VDRDWRWDGGKGEDLFEALGYEEAGDTYTCQSDLISRWLIPAPIMRT
jgi:hypothetical protein